ncbi:MAG: hypothetical protein LDL41_18430 [Coleofasciculus sp. S288]|nr:hypothetical protein [Coleofasciculus sp. S288]
MKLYRKMAAMPTGAALNLDTIENSIIPDQSPSITTYDFFIDVEDGFLTGHWKGFFSCDRSILTGISTEEIGVTEFQLKVEQRHFDGRGAASVFLEGGDLIGLNWRESWEFSKRSGDFIIRFLELWSIFDFRFLCTREVRRERLKTGELVDFLEDGSSYGLVRYEKHQGSADFRSGYRRRVGF